MLSYTIHDLANSEKPRERLVSIGPPSLSDSELLAIILRTGGRKVSVLELARRILLEFECFAGLAKTSLEQLTEIKYVGLAKAITIKAMCEIALRINLVGEERSSIRKTPEDIYRLLKKDLFGEGKEILYLVSLDSRNRVIAKDLISVGTVSETIVHPREIYRQALSRNAVSIVLVHNHPSQDIKPSTEDILVTEKVIKAGKLMGISLVDHVVVSDNDYCSLKALNLFKVSRKGVRK